MTRSVTLSRKLAKDLPIKLNARDSSLRSE